MGLFAAAASAQEAWPGGDETTRVDITQIDQDTDLSGAVWNPTMQELYVVGNEGELWRMTANGDPALAASWSVDQFWSIGGDGEGVMLADWAEDTVFVAIEREGAADERQVREIDVSGATPVIKGTWILTEMAGASPNLGAESITFVPNAWLSAKGFVDRDGNSYTSSVYGTGGLFFVGSQETGTVFVYDLDRAGGTAGDRPLTFVGEYIIGESEVAGLEFDRSSGILWTYSNYHATDAPDILRAVDITPLGTGTLKYFATLNFWEGPRIDNNEGIAIVPNDACDAAGHRLFFLTTDDAGPTNSLGIYPEFPCDPVLFDGTFDGFESQHFAGGIGWSGPWTVSGNIEASNSNSAHGGTRHAQLRDVASMERAVNLTGAVDARLRFWTRLRSFENSDSALVKVSDDGGATWTTVLTLGNGDDDNTYHFQDIDLGPYDMVSDFMIRFEINGSSSRDWFYVDDVEIAFEGGNTDPGNELPAASLGADVTEGEIPLAVSFDASGSIDPDGTIDKFEWDFDGDGVYDLDSGTTATADHTYTTAGVYIAKVRITDDGGAIATATLVITAEEPPPPPGIEVTVAFDGFESGDVSGGTGWIGSWSTSGDWQVRVDRGEASEGLSNVRLRDIGTIERRVDLTGVSNARLKFQGRIRSFESTDFAYVKISTDGGATYTTLITWTDDDDDNIYAAYDIDLSGFAMTSDVRIVFEAAMSSTKDYVYLDEIEVTGEY